MPEFRHVVDDVGAVALAEHLNGTQRRRPVVVVTIPAGRAEPYIDIDRIRQEVGDLADVFLIATGPYTWTFTRKMPPLTQVYGGAGRVYPIGYDWVANPYRSPIRFAYDEQEGGRATQSLISDALGMAVDAGLLTPKPSASRTKVTGIVAGVAMPERAMVTVNGRLATIAQELTVADVSLERIVAKGMRVEGWYEAATGRLDIRDSLLGREEALAAYAAGDLVLAQVTRVGADRTVVRLHPEVEVDVHRDQITGNDLDDLRDLLTPGEVLALRVITSGPAWELSLLDVDDDEAPRPAASLLSGGPAWLVEPEEPELGTPPAPAVMPELAGFVGSVPVVSAPPPEPTQPEVPQPQRPSPAILDPRRRGVPPNPIQPERPAAATAQMSLTIDSLRAEISAANRTIVTLTDEIEGGNAERASLVALRQEQTRHIGRLEDELLRLRAQLRKAKKPARGRAADAPAPAFADPEQRFRYAVTTAWATRIPAGEQAARPLPAYDMGPEFLRSLETVPDVPQDKVADVAVEILTGLAHQVGGRDLHQLRVSSAGGAAYARRAADGAICWRAAIQVNTPQARRIHYWQLPGGQIEFSRVTLHDDFEP